MHTNVTNSAAATSNYNCCNCCTQANTGGGQCWGGGETGGACNCWWSSQVDANAVEDVARAIAPCHPQPTRNLAVNIID